MTNAKIVTLDDYVCEHFGLTQYQMRGVDICNFNDDERELPLDRSLQSVTYGDHSFGVRLDDDPELARAFGIRNDRGPTVRISTTPLSYYLETISRNPPYYMRSFLDSLRGHAVGNGYVINMFAPKERFRENIFDDICDALKEKLPSEIQIDEATQTDNDYIFFGRGGSEGGDFRFRNLFSNSCVEQLYHGKVKQYTSRFGGLHRLGWIYPNQIQLNWKGDPYSTIGFVKSVAELVQEREYEAHFELPIDHNGLMYTGFGISGVFYKPKVSGKQV